MLFIHLDCVGMSSSVTEIGIMDLFHGSHFDMTSQVNTGVINKMYYGSVPFSEPTCKRAA